MSVDRERWNEQRPAPADDRGKLLTVQQAAARWNVDYDTALRWCRNGAVPFVTVGPYKLIRIFEKDVEAAIQGGSV